MGNNLKNLTKFQRFVAFLIILPAIPFSLTLAFITFIGNLAYELNKKISKPFIDLKMKYEDRCYMKNRAKE